MPIHLLASVIKVAEWVVTLATRECIIYACFYRVHFDEQFMSPISSQDILIQA